MAMLQDGVYQAANAVSRRVNDGSLYRTGQKIGYRLVEELVRLREYLNSLIFLHFAPNDRCLTRESSIVDIRRRMNDGVYITDESFFEFLVPLVERVRNYAAEATFSEDLVKYVVLLYLYLTETMAV